MRRFVLATLLVASSAFAQSAPQPNSEPFRFIPQPKTSPVNPRMSAPEGNDTRCPVLFTNVALEQDAHYLPVNTGSSSNRGQLHFDYRNLIGKEIASISVEVTLRAKQNIYTLDAAPIVLSMKLSAGSPEQPVTASAYIYGVDQVSLKQVMYADGSMWLPTSVHACGYQHQGGAVELGTLDLK